MIIQKISERLEEYVPNILVIGDLIIDHYIYGSSNRISPEAPVPVLNISEEKFLLGGAGNVLNNLLSLGANVGLISVKGKCENSNILKKLLNKKSLSFSFLLEEDNRVTSKKTRLISSNQQVVRYDHETIVDILLDTEKTLIDLYEENIENFDLVIISDYNKGLLTKTLTSKIISIANQKNIKVLVDPKGSDYKKYSGAYLLTPNKKEASEAINININDKKSLLRAIKNLKKNYSLTNSLITLSEEGIALFDSELRIYPTAAKDVFDVTGAGDTVIASIGFSLALNLDIRQAIEFANLAASVVVSKLGSATTTLSEISGYHHHDFSLLFKEKIISRSNIYSILQKIGNSKVVFTNGCFDIIHSGHIKYLSKSRELGDILIVGLNSDRSVRSIKGKSRPINNQKDRALVLSSLAMVDYVVIFDEDDPSELISAIKPDILTKGADYTNKKIIGSDIAKETVLIDFEKGKSTSNIIKIIKTL